ncbi:MAG: zinc ribbon domain-containing protein [Anaerolineae bacterium]|nr:zinc ribbon domain-containing protein [Anaerolineae bacterium]
MATEVCSHCGKPLRVGARFCPACGAAQSQSPELLCPHCKAVTRPGAKFCSVCGQPIAQPVPRTTFPRRRWVVVTAISLIILFVLMGVLITFRKSDADLSATVTPRVAATLTAQAATPTLPVP